MDLPSAGGGTEAGGPIPTVGQLSESGEKHLRLRVKQLTCGSLNGMRLLAVAMHTLDTGPLEGTARSRSWSLGIVEQSQCEGCC